MLDSLYYRRPTSTPLNFLLTNISSVSLFYGANAWHYYLTQALPILCTTALPFVLHGIWFSVFDKHAIALRNMFYCVVWSVCIYSFAGHKEWRFMHPILPLLHSFAAKSLVDLSDRAKTYGRKTTDKISTKHLPFRTQLSQYLPPVRLRFLALLCLTIPVSAYTVLFYRSAPISVIAYVRSLPAAELDGGVGFLMPCHSTPGQAYLHRRELSHGKMWALGCEPPLWYDVAKSRIGTCSLNALQGSGSFDISRPDGRVLRVAYWISSNTISFTSRPVISTIILPYIYTRDPTSQ